MDKEKESSPVTSTDPLPASPLVSASKYVVLVTDIYGEEETVAMVSSYALATEDAVWAKENDELAKEVRIYKLTEIAWYGRNSKPLFK